MDLSKDALLPDQIEAIFGQREVDCVGYKAHSHGPSAEDGPAALINGLLACGRAWKPYTVTDGNLITGQNPASSDAGAKAVCNN